MHRSVCVAAVGTLLVVIGGTLWVPVESRAGQSVRGVVDDPGGRRSLILSPLQPSRPGRDWLWRSFPAASRPDAPERLARLEVGDEFVAQPPVVRWVEAVVHLAALAALGSLLTIGLHTWARRRAARLAGLVAACTLPMELPRAGGLSREEHRHPLFGRSVRRLGATALALSAMTWCGLAWLTRGPATVERRGLDLELPRDNGFRGHRPIRVTLRSEAPSPPAEDPADAEEDFWPPVAVLDLVGDLDRKQVDAVRKRLHALDAERRTDPTTNPGWLGADATVPWGRFAQVLDLLRSEGVERSLLEEGERPTERHWTPAPDLRPGVEAARPRARTAARYRIATTASIDLHIGGDGSMAVRLPGDAGNARPTPVTPDALFTALRGSIRSLPDEHEPYLSGLTAFLHADTEVPFGAIVQVLQECAKVGVWRLAIVVEPLAPAASSR